MALASTAQVRAPYNDIVARGEMATPATVAKELGSGYSLASISNKLATIKHETVRQGQVLSRTATTAPLRRPQMTMTSPSIESASGAAKQPPGWLRHFVADAQLIQLLKFG